MTRVSFVIPTRNQAPFLRRCLDSCLAQGLPGAEVLVQDGGSTDGTPAILASYGDRVRWISEPDGGQAQAVNRAVARATGDVVAWINSDDCYAGPGVLGPAVAAFDADPAVDLVFGEAQVVTAEGAPLRPYRSRPFASARDLLVSPIGPPQPATLFRRALFLEAGGLREDLHLTLDYELWLRLLPRARRTARLPDTLACMTFHPGAKSTAAMGAQIRELGRVKREAAARLGLGPLDRLRLHAGQAALHAYRLAVLAGLRRAG